MDNNDRIWNRALGFEDSYGKGDGDVALRATLALNNLYNNGGVMHAIEVLDGLEEDGEGLGVQASIDGHRWFGLDAAANVIETTRAALESNDPDDEDAAEELEITSNDDYSAAVDGDAAIEAAFQRKLVEEPGAFDPLV